MGTPRSIGKLRGLQQCATGRGAFSVLALDHRQNLRKALNPVLPGFVTDADLILFKSQIASTLGPVASSILLDPEYGAAQCIASGKLPGNTGLVVAIEATGYGGETNARQSRILPGWSVAKAKRLGASAVKLLVYYHPHAPTASDIEAFVRQVAADCEAHDIALFLEPLSYSLDPAKPKLEAADRRHIVIETARRLVTPGVDVLKAEFPLDITTESDEHEWAAACQELSDASMAPWVLLSASVDYDTYLRQARVACEAGASGVAVGRAVWKESVSLSGEERSRFLYSTGRQRMARLTALCESLAKPWTDFYAALPVSAEWYSTY
jgi:tagatose-1,6-bisphosphate aldolase